MATTAKRAATRTAAAFKPVPTTARELAPANIASASRISADLVVVKLREQPGAPVRAPASGKTGAPQARLRMISARELNQMLGAAVAPTESAVKRNADDNQAFMDRLARQEQQRRTELREQGQLLDARQLAARLAVSVQSISRACREGRMFALDGAHGRLLYPAFYADPELSRTTLGRITKLLGDLPPSAKWQFFTTPKQSLNRHTPLDALRQGQLAAVQQSAVGFRER